MPLDSFCVRNENGSYFIHGDSTVNVLCRTLTDACLSAVYSGKVPDIYECTYSGLLNELRQSLKTCLVKKKSDRCINCNEST